MSIGVLIVDDHRMMRETLRSLIESAPGIKVVEEAENGRMAVQFAREKKPAVVVMDLVMPVMGGIEATRLITTEMPDVKVLGVSMHSDSLSREALRQAGASAFVAKDSVFEELVPAIKAVIANESEWSSQIDG